MSIRNDLWKAYKQLYPNAEPLRDYILRDDGAGPYLAYFDPALGARPTTAQEDAAIAAYDAAKTRADADAAALHTAIVTTAQSAVGVAITQLTATQVRALAAILLWRIGAVANDGTIRPLAEWAR